MLANNKKVLLQMKDLALTSQSIVLIADLNIDNQIINFNDLVFNGIATASYLTKMVKTVFNEKINFISNAKESNNLQTVFNFDNGLQIIYDRIPTRLSIKYDTTEKNIDKIKQIYEYIIDDEEIKDRILAIGINFNFSTSENKSKLLTILKDSSQEGMNSVKIVAQYDILGFQTNFNFNDLPNENVTILVNFHKNTAADKDAIDNIFTNKNFITEAEKKINLLYHDDKPEK